MYVNFYTVITFVTYKLTARTALCIYKLDCKQVYCVKVNTFIRAKIKKNLVLSSQAVENLCACKSVSILLTKGETSLLTALYKPVQENIQVRILRLEMASLGK